MWGYTKNTYILAGKHKINANKSGEQQTKRGKMPLSLARNVASLKKSGQYE